MIQVYKKGIGIKKNKEMEKISRMPVAELEAYISTRFNWFSQKKHNFTWIFQNATRKVSVKFFYSNASSYLRAPKNYMSKQPLIKQDGIIVEALSNAMFKVKLQNDREILATISGKMRMHYIRILPGDKVGVEMSPYDLTRGRIIFRYK